MHNDLPQTAFCRVPRTPLHDDRNVAALGDRNTLERASSTPIAALRIGALKALVCCTAWLQARASWGHLEHIGANLGQSRPQLQWASAGFSTFTKLASLCCCNGPESTLPRAYGVQPLDSRCRNGLDMSTYTRSCRFHPRQRSVAAAGLLTCGDLTALRPAPLLLSALCPDPCFPSSPPP